MSDDTFFQDEEEAPEEMAPEAVAPAPAPETKAMSITISFLPGFAGQRKTILCAQHEGKAPQFEIIHEPELGLLPSSLTDLLDQAITGVDRASAKTSFEVAPVKTIETKKPKPAPQAKPSLSLWD